MIITVGGIKGGSGKTTIATNLVVWFSKQGKDVLLVDADDQQTATDFTTWREESLKGTVDGDIGYTTVKLNGDNVRTQIQKLKNKYDHIVIDTGGRDTTSQRSAIVASDVYLVPFNPRSFDMWTLTKVENLIKEIVAVKPTPLKVFSFLNRTDFRGSDNKDAADGLKNSDSMTFIDAYLGNRKSFSNAASKGFSVLELNPVDEKALSEITKLFDLIFKNQES